MLADSRFQPLGQKFGQKSPHSRKPPIPGSCRLGQPADSRFQPLGQKLGQKPAGCPPAADSTLPPSRRFQAAPQPPIPGASRLGSPLAGADRLLADSLLPVWRITELLGYSSIQVFIRAYLRRKGRRPRDFRRQSPGNNPLLAKTPGESSQDLLTRALAGQLDEQAAATLIRRLLEVYPPQHPRRSEGMVRRLFK